MPPVLNDALLQYLNPDHTIQYVREIFKNCLDINPEWMVEVRKLGQITETDGASETFQDSSTCQLLGLNQADWQNDLAQWVAAQVRKAAHLGVGIFMAPALLNDRRANDQSIQLLATVCADFDHGNPQAALEQICQHLGIRPTFVCTSGGTTAEGYPKLHAHWRLDEPCYEPWKVAHIREQIALRYGADTSFKRIPQIIRIPGALYDKNGKWGTTIITEYNNHDVGLMAWEELLGISWDEMEPKESPKRSKAERANRLHALQTETVEAGRTADTRFDRFSEYAGHQIRQARFKHQTVEEALTSVKHWVQDKMVPPWSEERIENEFNALLQRDQTNHADAWAERDAPPIIFGNGPSTIPDFRMGTVPPQPAPPPVQEQNVPAWSLATFDAAKYYAGEAPPERHLVKNFLVYKSSVALVSDGGVGKTYLALELGLRAAAGPSLKNNRFLGFDVLEKVMVVILTVEDGKDDIHRRINAIDPDGSLREASIDHCIIVPIHEENTDGLTLVERDKSGNLGPSLAWKGMLHFIEEYINDMRQRNGMDLPLLIIIDTYSATHHSDENSATGANEWFRAVARLKKFNSTLLITHHIRKTDPKMEIRNVADMKSAVRGSTAFMNALRFVVGIWKMPNDSAVLKEAAVERSQKLFNMGILKNNTGIDWAGRSDSKFEDPLITLSRGASGQLHYNDFLHSKRLELSGNKKERMAAARDQLKAAILYLVQWMAAHGCPLSLSQIASERATLLPPKLSFMSKSQTKSAIEELIKEGRVKEVKVKGVPNGSVLDVPEGLFYLGHRKERASESPKLVWAKFKYHEETGSFSEIPDLENVIDF